MTTDRSLETRDEHLETRIELDIEGNQRSVTDPRGVVVVREDFDVLRRSLHRSSPDSGDRWTLLDVRDKPVLSWDSRTQAFRYTYDILGRSTHLHVASDDSDEKLAQRVIYGDLPGTPGAAKNLRGQVFRAYDGAGVVTNVEYDFKGNLVESSRRLFDHRQGATNALEPKNSLAPDWSLIDQPGMTPDEIAHVADDLLEPPSPDIQTEFVVKTDYDALNRVALQATPDGSVTRRNYNAAGLLESVAVWHHGLETSKPFRPSLLAGGDEDDDRWTPFISAIDYNARGQRMSVTYGNGCQTQYSYDNETFRLVTLTTLRNNTRLQDLAYCHDPVGNITEIRDGAQQTVFYDGAVAEPRGLYRYDALYRLIRADGREHPGLQPDESDAPQFALPHPNDTQALSHYVELYTYDPADNIEMMAHVGESSWTRCYAYNADENCEPVSNRLLCTSLPGDIIPDQHSHCATESRRPYSARYEHDAHGNMTRMPHLMAMHWDHADRLSSIELAGAGRVHYSYDLEGKRVRKLVNKGGKIEEHTYIGQFEIFRKYMRTNLQFERETLHIVGDQERTALVETVTWEDGVTVEATAPRCRYQLSNHLLSTLLELSDAGDVITYEEYFPYGGTAYRSARTTGRYRFVEESPRRYRYNGKERDEETGLYYYRARYYAAWLGRWTAADPSGLSDGLNVFTYVNNRPVLMQDPDGAKGRIPEGWTYIGGVSGHHYYDVPGMKWDMRGPDPNRETQGLAASVEGSPSASQTERVKSTAAESSRRNRTTATRSDRPTTVAGQKRNPQQTAPSTTRTSDAQHVLDGGATRATDSAAERPGFTSIEDIAPTVADIGNVNTAAGAAATTAELGKLPLKAIVGGGGAGLSSVAGVGSAVAGLGAAATLLAARAFNVELGGFGTAIGYVGDLATAVGSVSVAAELGRLPLAAIYGGGGAGAATVVGTSAAVIGPGVVGYSAGSLLNDLFVEDVVDLFEPGAGAAGQWYYENVLRRPELPTEMQQWTRP